MSKGSFEISGSLTFAKTTRNHVHTMCTQSCPPALKTTINAPGLLKLCALQWRTQKISEGRAKFRHNHVTSQINFRGSAEGTTILGGSGGMPLGKFCTITPKNTHFCAFWKQILDNTVFTFFYF